MKKSRSNLYLPRMRPLPGRRAVVMSVLDVGSTKISRWYLRSASNLARARAKASSCEPPGRPRLVGRLRRREPLAMRVSSCADHASTLYITCV